MQLKDDFDPESRWGSVSRRRAVYCILTRLVVFRSLFLDARLPERRL
jgi:hypothetical protein